MEYSTDQAIALAPDAASVKACKKLVAPSKWPLLGHNDEAAWGHCQGSGKKPYYVQVDLNGPAFKCSCPSRKFPCKHGLALLLLRAGQPEAFSREQTPDWVREWLDKREQRQKTRVAKAEQKAETQADPKKAAKTREKRIKAMTQGLEDCELWLRDLVANGLSTVRNQGYSFWDNAASRLVDAKAPGAAGMLQNMSRIAAAGAADWLSELALEIGRLFLLIKAFRRFEKLEESQQADVRTVAGWPIEQSEVLAGGQTMKGAFSAVGKSIRDNGKMKEQRLWLRHADTGAMAMVLSFSYGNQPLDTSLMPATAFDAELAFYPGAMPLRALIKERAGETRPIGSVNGDKSIEQALEKYARALALNPWTTLFPVVVENLTPLISNDRLVFVDRDGRQVPAHSKFSETWECMALSGGRGMTVVGEWWQRSLLPLACANEEGFHHFSFEWSV